MKAAAILARSSSPESSSFLSESTTSSGDEFRGIEEGIVEEPLMAHL